MAGKEPGGCWPLAVSSDRPRALYSVLEPWLALRTSFHNRPVAPALPTPVQYGLPYPSLPSAMSAETTSIVPRIFWASACPGAKTNCVAFAVQRGGGNSFQVARLECRWLDARH